MAVLKIRGKDGNITDILSIKGENGNQMFVRFSAYADGTDMSERWDAERDYMGIAFAATAPTDKAAYQWLQLASLSFGRYAEEGSAEKYLFFIGNGTGEDDRSNALTLDDEGNLNVTGDVTFGEDKFSPREAVAEQKEYIDKQIEEHTITADRVTDLTEFMEEYNTARSISGSYVGTGSAEHSLTLPFAPKQFIIQSSVELGSDTSGYGAQESWVATLIRGGATSRAYFQVQGFISGEGFQYGVWRARVSNEGKTIALIGAYDVKSNYCDSLNTSGKTYHYIAIG